MCSPKIREDLVPRIYGAPKTAHFAMTKWVNNLSEAALSPELQQQPAEESARKEISHE